MWGHFFVSGGHFVGEDFQIFRLSIKKTLAESQENLDYFLNKCLPRLVFTEHLLMLMYIEIWAIV